MEDLLISESLCEALRPFEQPLTDATPATDAPNFKNTELMPVYTDAAD